MMSPDSRRAQQHLPVWQIHSSLLQTLRSGNRLVLVAPTGSGKTTQVPQMLLDAGLLPSSQKIVILQPRRVAARTVATRVAWERNVRLGQEVGYQIRFDDQTSLGTRLCFVTEGILLRWLQDDPSLADIGAVLFDEFHERSLLSDVALALVKQLQQERRPDLRIIVMSATLEAEPVADYLSSSSGSGINPPCPILVSEGQSYPVEVRYAESHDERPLPEQAAEVVEQIVNSGADGDVLVFMPGRGEISATINACRSISTRERLALIPLHGELQPEEQDLAFAPHALRKVVVSTNVAETSVTIDGIIHVVDAGVARVARYDAERGVGTLFIEPISRASADQRKGRAGRTAPGVCHRLWTRSGHLDRPERNTPEIQRSDLAEVVLLLHSLHIRKAARFDWLDKPDPVAVERAENLLRMLGALDPVTDELTPIGEQMRRLPMHPRYSRMLVEAAKLGCVQAASLCAALVSGRDLLQRLRREDAHIAEARELFEASQESDFFTLIRAYQFARNQNFHVESCRRYGIQAQSARQVEQTFSQILQIATQQKLLRPDEKPDDTALLRCLTAGFIDQLCLRRDTGTLECDLSEGRSGTLARESVVQNSPLFVVALIREIPGRNSGNVTLLNLASAVKREWLMEMFPQHLQARVEHQFDRTHKRVAAIRFTRFADLVIQSEHERSLDPVESGKCLAAAFQAGLFELPLLNHELKQWIARVNLVCAALPELEFPPLDQAGIAACLARSFCGLGLAKEAQATPLRTEFLKHLAHGQLAWLDELAPTSITWLDDRKLKLQYAEGSTTKEGRSVPPELQLKLTECFQLKQHPQICEGRVAVRLWLCTPDGKRLDSTTDWPAFRQTAYPKLRSALQKKFPGTVWV